MNAPPVGLKSNDSTEYELAAHGLDFVDALAVWYGPARYFPQAARDLLDEFGNPRRQPERLKMIGPDRRGRLLTFILELSGIDGQSHVVTGWESDRDEQTRYLNQEEGCGADADSRWYRLRTGTPELDVEAEKPGRTTLQVEFMREELTLLRRATERGPSLIRFVKAAALEKSQRLSTAADQQLRETD